MGSGVEVQGKASKLFRASGQTLVLSLEIWNPPEVRVRQSKVLMFLEGLGTF